MNESYPNEDPKRTPENTAHSVRWMIFEYSRTPGCRATVRRTPDGCYVLTDMGLKEYPGRRMSAIIETTGTIRCMLSEPDFRCSGRNKTCRAVRPGTRLWRKIETYIEPIHKNLVMQSVGSASTDCSAR